MQNAVDAPRRVTSAAMRTPGTPPLDDGDERELDAILETLRPLFRI